MNDPLVSICCITYNHEQYIRDAIDGFLMQNTDFPFEICLGEDESNDGTREICQEYADKFPDKIRLFLRSRKDVIYINGQATGRYNFIETLKECKGKYIALCDGDDYWTDPLKLQKQVDFMEASPNSSICFHPVIIRDDRYKGIKYSQEISLNWQMNFDTLLLSCYIHTSSVLFRHSTLNKIPTWLSNISQGDWALFLLFSKKGNIGFINETMGVYRRHSKGLWTKQDRIVRLIKEIQMFNIIGKEFRINYLKNFRISQAKRHLKLSSLFRKKGFHSLANHNALRGYLWLPSFNNIDGLKSIIHNVLL